MKKETLDAMHDAIICLQINTKITDNDIRSLVSIYDENRKQIIINTFATMKAKIDFLETEINLIDGKNHFVEA